MKPPFFEVWDLDSGNRIFHGSLEGAYELVRHVYDHEDWPTLSLGYVDNAGKTTKVMDGMALILAAGVKTSAD